jgi:DNA polymerase III alpha subunit
MKINGRAQAGYSQRELVDYLRIRPETELEGVAVTDPGIYNRALTEMFSELPPLNQWQDCELDQRWHHQQQNTWLMPQDYADIDIAKLLLERCENDAELQRMAKELLMFQDRELLPMLNYLYYLVETLKSHGVVLGVGRGSSVASFALYKLGVHRVNSLYWDLDINEFLKGEINA